VTTEKRVRLRRLPSVLDDRSAPHVISPLFTTSYVQGVGQQSTTDRASPASLVSLYLLFMSFAVSASAWIVASRSTRCREAISLLAIAYAVHAFTAPKAHRSTHGTCT
jgi:hypothetical protein